MSDEQSYVHARSGTSIPVPGGKQITELIGRVRSGTGAISLAHMVAPAGWGEPAQTPEFGELTLVVRGRMSIEVGDDKVEVAAGEAIWTPAGVRVRHGNPFDREAEYYAVCFPAFSPDLVHREVAETEA